MKKLSVLVVCTFILALTSTPAIAQISYCKDIIEPGNPGGLGSCDIIGGQCTTDLDCAGGALACLNSSLKTWDETWEMNVGETIEMDIWQNDVPESLLTAGCYIAYDPALIDITTLVPNDTDNGGQWEGNNTASFEIQPGQWLLSLADFGCIEPDGDGDILLATVTFQCQGPGNADITIQTIPDFDTVVGCGGTIYDSAIAPNTVTIFQGGCECTSDQDCDDGLYCNGAETCDIGTCVCQPGTPPDCDDGVDCTDDICDEDIDSCVNIPNDANCPDDGLYCNGDEVCDPAVDCSSSGDPCSNGEVCDVTDDICIFLDADGDGIPDSEDNCPDTPNRLQRDTLPPQGNDIGDACDCEGNFDCDLDVDGSDAATFKIDFGRSRFLNPCTNESQCKGDFDCDHDVDGTDAAKFKEDFGRSEFLNPCPVCEVGDWCTYEEPKGVGGACGDPHFYTFDGLYYHNQFIGEFVLSREIGGTGFEVHSRQGRLGRFSPCVTLNTAVAMRLDNNVVEYRASSNEILIDRTVIVLSEGNEQILSGGGIVQRNKGIVCHDASSMVTVRVRDLGDYLCVTVYVDASMKNTLEGLLGNFDDNRSNELMLRNGEQALTISSFMENWRLLDAESLFTYPPGQDTGTYTGIQSCNIHLTAGHLEAARQIYITHFSEEVCDDAMIIAIATELAGGMTEEEILEWITDFLTPIHCPVTRWYEDADGDGYGNIDIFLESDTQPMGYVPDNTDCDDTNPNINPGALEILEDQIDNNCNGFIDEDGDIININGRSSASIPLSCTAGNYIVIPIGTSNGGQYNAWSPWRSPNPWLNTYRIFSDEWGEIIVNDSTRYDTALEALANSDTVLFSLENDGIVYFYIVDSPYYDNRGGISLQVIKIEDSNI